MTIRAFFFFPWEGILAVAPYASPSFTGDHYGIPGCTTERSRINRTVKPVHMVAVAATWWAVRLSACPLLTRAARGRQRLFRVSELAFSRLLWGAPSVVRGLTQHFMVAATFYGCSVGYKGSAVTTPRKMAPLAFTSGCRRCNFRKGRYAI